MGGEAWRPCEGVILHRTQPGGSHHRRALVENGRLLNGLNAIFSHLNEPTPGDQDLFPKPD
jgi:hypothetical protein